jgi:hypothetical protein
MEIQAIVDAIIAFFNVLTVVVDFLAMIWGILEPLLV